MRLLPNADLSDPQNWGTDIEHLNHWDEKNSIRWNCNCCQKKVSKRSERSYPRPAQHCHEVSEASGQPNRHFIQTINFADVTVLRLRLSVDCQGKSTDNYLP
jgi:hypothetical protein